MSTRSRIAMKLKDGTYKSIYCHSDGYLEYNGALLYNEYQDPTKIKLLLDLGDLSCLGKNVYPDTSKEHNFSNRQEDVTVAYHRDRDEDLHYLISDDLFDLIDATAHSDQEYLYVYEDGKWSYADTRTQFIENIEMCDLENDLLEKHIIDQPKLSKNYLVEELANELVNYAKKFDTYEYKDVYDNDDEKAFDDMVSSLSKDKIDTTLEWLSNDLNYLATEKDLTDNEMLKLSQNAFNLMCKVNCYKTVLEKDKEMDMC